MLDIQKNKEEFINLYTTNITRKGSKNLLKYLEETDFFSAPASSVYHLNEEGGLCKHTLNVYYRLHRILENEYGDKYLELIDNEGIAIIALLHDICKANYYKLEMRNVKDENGKWIQKPYYKVDEQLHYGHGSKSVFIIQQFMQLYLDEAMAIRYHMGGMEYPNANFIEPNVTAVYNDYPMALFVHLADLEASYIDERIDKNE